MLAAGGWRVVDHVMMSVGSLASRLFAASFALPLSLSSDTHLSEEEKYVTQKMEAFRGKECHRRPHPRHYLPPQCVCVHARAERRGMRAAAREHMYKRA
jgi:hypothetical protein